MAVFNAKHGNMQRMNISTSMKLCGLMVLSFGVVGACGTARPIAPNQEGVHPNAPNEIRYATRATEKVDTPPTTERAGSSDAGAPPP
jgi:hypothetical protein